MKPQTTAIIIVDNNNDFLSEGGKFYPAVKPVLERKQVVANINHAITEARKRNVAVFHVPLAYSPDYHEMGPEPYGIFKAIKDAGAFQSGTWGGRIGDEIAVGDSDIVVEGKNTTCAFATTDLKEELDRRGIKTIALGGVLSNICIESTMRTGYDHGYEVITLTDCSAALSQDRHDTAIDIDWPLLSRPMTSRDFLSAL